jgi:hypothetical protein
MKIISGNFQKTDKSLRTEFDSFGLKSLAANADCPLDRIVITRFYGADDSRNNLNNKSTVTLWRPKIVDVQHDTLDYSTSDAVTWQIGVRYESVTYENQKEERFTRLYYTQNEFDEMTKVMVKLTIKQFFEYTDDFYDCVWYDTIVNLTRNELESHHIGLEGNKLEIYISEILTKNTG